MPHFDHSWMGLTGWLESGTALVARRPAESRPKTTRPAGHRSHGLADGPAWAVHGGAGDREAVRISQASIAGLAQVRSRMKPLARSSSIKEDECARSAQ